MVRDRPAASLQREKRTSSRPPGSALDPPPRPRRRGAPPSSLEPERRPPAPDRPVPDAIAERSSTRPFPVAVVGPRTDGRRWLRETAAIARRRTTRTVVRIVGDDEIECVDSDDGEIDIIEEFPVTNSQSAEEGNAAAMSSSCPKTSDGRERHRYSSDELEILRGTARDSRMDDLGPAKRRLVSKLLDGTAHELAEEYSPDDVRILVGEAEDVRLEDLDADPARRLLVSMLLDGTANELAEEYSPDDVRILEGKAEDLRIEDLDAETRRQVQNLLCRSEIARDDDEGAGTTNNGNCDEGEAQSTLDHVRRTAVGITGGTLTVAGVALIPCPIVPGSLVVYGGLLVLATEFDAAKRALDRVREPIEQWLADDDEKEGDSDLEKDKPVKAMKQFLRNILIGDANKQIERDNVPMGGSHGSTPIPRMDDRM